MGRGDYDNYDDYYDGPRRWPKLVAAAGLLAAIGLVLFLVLRPSGDSTSTFPSANPSVTTSPLFSTSTSSSTSTAALGAAGDETAVDTAGASVGSDVITSDSGSVDTARPDRTDTTTTDPSSTDPGGGAAAATATSSAEVDPPVPGSGSNTSTTVLADTSAGTSPTVPTGATYPTDPDGSARPVVAIFDTSTITLTGQVPSQAAVERLSALALANSQTDATIVNNLIVNPSVPLGVGVRVIELNSPRFPEGSSTVLPDHAAQLERVAVVMRALPQVSVLVIGHADQRGTDVANFAISEARARAVVNYLVYVGIEPARLSSRAVGANDLLAVDDDAASLALNRRTEFVFYGLLVE